MLRCAPLSPRTDAIFAREPLVDPYTPASSDLDLLVFANVSSLLPERLALDLIKTRDSPPIDLIWLPTSTLTKPATFAADGLIPHRIFTSRPVFIRNILLSEFLQKIHAELYSPSVHAGRIHGFLEMAFYAVREIGITWNFPSLALFWLHIAHTACIAAILDGARRFCPNIYTRPLEYVRQAEICAQTEIEPTFCATLGLLADLPELITRLRRIHHHVYTRFPEPEWPDNMHTTTKYEYRYFRNPEELAWRIVVAEEMTEGGEIAAAVFYLRFFAYSLARLPMVYHRALEGIDVSFMRPERGVLKDLNQHCPEILDDLSLVLAPPDIAAEDVEESLAMLFKLRDTTLAYLGKQGITLDNLRPWQPFRPK